MMEDYTKYSESSNNEVIKSLEECTVEELVEVAVNEDVVFENSEMTKEELIATIEANREQNVQPEVKEVEPITYDIRPAKITGCTRLNVRKEPSKDSEVVCVITSGNTITVCMEYSTEDFYKVHTTVGETLVEGYCMKQFISVE